MKRDTRMPRLAGPTAADSSAAIFDDVVASLQDKAAKASLKALDASIMAGSSPGAHGLAATALELAELAVQMNRMTGDLAVALKILEDAAPPPAFALEALDRLVVAEGAGE